MLVDTNGFLLHLLVHEANIQDHQGGKLLLEPLQGVFPHLELIWADSAYEKGNFEAWVKERFGWDVEIVKHWWTGCAMSGWLLDKNRQPFPPASMSSNGVGSWRTPNHNTPETVRLTEPTPCPMLGMSGLLNLLTWVEHRQLAQTSQHEEGGVPCPVPPPTRLPPARFQTSHRSVGGSAAGQSEASPLAVKPLARTSAGAKPRTRQGGRR